MKLIFGLGNPGKKYEKTRHNTGFMAVDKIKQTLGAPDFRFEKIFNAEISEGVIDDEKIILVKPQTFMNETGKAVKAIADYRKISPENILVIHDDLDILLGEYKTVQNRGSAGHKGVQSIIDSLGTKDFTRIRIGTLPQAGKPENAEKFVLENFTKEEEKIIAEVIEKVCEEIEEIIDKTNLGHPMS